MPPKSGPPTSVIDEGRQMIRKLKGLIANEDAIVLEIGCNDGMHSRIFLEEFKSEYFQLHCFEPDVRPLARFHKLVGHDDRMFGPYQVAIAAYDGTTTFHLSGGTHPNSWVDDWDLSSSIHRPTGHLQRSPWVTFNRQIEVPCQRLDSWLEPRPHLEKIDLVWADVQGAEGDMIRGGQEAFANKVRYLFCEFSDVEMYEGQITKKQLLELLPSYVELGVFHEDILLKNTKFP